MQSLIKKKLKIFSWSWIMVFKIIFLLNKITKVYLYKKEMSIEGFSVNLAEIIEL